jgi:hypothetical protein
MSVIPYMMKVIPETCCVLQDMQVFTTAQKQMLMSNVQLFQTNTHTTFFFVK